MSRSTYRFPNRKKTGLFAISVVVLAFLTSCIMSDNVHERDFTGVVAIKDAAVTTFIAKEPITAIHVEISNLSRTPEIFSEKNTLEFSYMHENSAVIVIGFREMVLAGESLFHLTDLPGLELDDLFIEYAGVSPLLASSGDSSLEEPRLIGDFNGDGVVDIVDFGRFVGAYLSKKGDARFSADYDINTSEWAYGGVWTNIYSFQPPDAPDDQIDIKDFGIFIGNYQRRHPYRGNWTFEGYLHERTTEEYGLVTGTATGAATVTMSNHEFCVEGETHIDVQSEKKGDFSFSLEFDSSKAAMDFDFSAGTMTFIVGFKNPYDATEYTAILEGALKRVGDDVFTEIENGTLRLAGSEEVLGTWIGEKK